MKGDCVVNLDGFKGKHPPLLIQDGVFKYPTSETERNLGFSKYLDDRLICVQSWVHIHYSMQGDGDQLDLYCHGSLKNQEKTTVKIGRKNTGLSSFSLECKDGKFVGVEDKVTCRV